MSVKRRCFSYCHDSADDNSWKIVETDKHFHEKKPKHPESGNQHQDSDSDSDCDKKKPARRWVKDDCHNKQPQCYKKEKKSKGNCCNFLCTLVSVKNPDTILPIPELLNGSPAIAQNGECVDLTGWSDIVPDALNAFNNATGIYTAPESGDYQVSLTVNFRTSLSIPVSETLLDVPFIEVYDVDTDGKILTSAFPVTALLIVVPPLATGEPPVDVFATALLTIGQVIINAVIPLTEGQRIRFRACTNGLHFIPPLISDQQLPSPASIDLSPPGLDTTLAIYKIRNSPRVVIHCNN